MKKVINHHWGLCDPNGNVFPVGIPIEGTPELIDLAESRKQINGEIMVTFLEEEMKVKDVIPFDLYEGDIPIIDKFQGPSPFNGTVEEVTSHILEPGNLRDGDELPCDEPDCKYVGKSLHALTIHKSRAHKITLERANAE